MHRTNRKSNWIWSLFALAALLLPLVAILGPSDFAPCNFEREIKNPPYTPRSGAPAVQDFNWYKNITIDHTKVAGSVSSFPVLISLFDADLHKYAQADGDDIAFAGAGGWLNFEIETYHPNYNSTHAQLIAWVRLPSLSPNVDTNISLYYGNVSMASLQNRTGVWNTNYRSVLHFNEDPASGALHENDSTHNANHGIVLGSMSSADWIPGKIGKAINFDGVDDALDFPVDFTAGQSEVCIEMWVNLDAWNESTAIYDAFFYRWKYDYWQFSLYEGPFYTRDNSTGNNGTRDNDIYWQNPGLNAWHYLVVRYSVANKLKGIYVDGVMVNSSKKSVDKLLSDRTAEQIGKSITRPAQYNNYDGKIDELRISTGSSRTPSWIATSYQNQNDPTSFFRIGDAIDLKPPILTNPEESADPLELGYTEIINVTAMDEGSVAQVNLEYDGANHTMTAIGGNKWQFKGWRPSRIGTYPFTIHARDAAGNWNSLAGSLLVMDTKPPTFNPPSESADPLELGGIENLAINITDLSGIAWVKLQYQGTNHSMNKVSEITWQWDTWIPTMTGIYLYSIWMQDNASNMISYNGSVTVIDTTPPDYSDLNDGETSLELGKVTKIRINVTDKTGVGEVVLEFEGKNYTMTWVHGNRWESHDIKPKMIGSLHFIIHLKDTCGNQKSVGGTIQVVDTTAPPPPMLMRAPAGEIDGKIEFELLGDFDEAGIASFHLIVSTGNDPNRESNRVFETCIPYNGTGSISYILEETLSPGTYYYFLYEIDGSGLESSAVGGSFLIKGNPAQNPTSPMDLGLVFAVIIIIGTISGLAFLVAVKRSHGRGRAEPVALQSHGKVVKMPEYVSEEELTHKRIRGQSGVSPEIAQSPKAIQTAPSPLLHPPPDSVPAEPPITEAKSVLDTNNLITLMENAEAIREYGLALQYASKLVDAAEKKQNKTDLAEYRQKQQKYLALDLTAKREKAEKDAIDAEKSANYAKAAKLYELCKNLSNQLYKNGNRAEDERIKYFTVKSISIWKLVADTTTFAKEEPP